MKILQLTTHVNMGGITSYLLTLGKALSKKGHRSVVLSSGGSLVEDLQFAGIPSMLFPIRTKSIIHPKLYMSLPAIIRQVKDNKFDLLHAHSRVAQVLAFWISQQTGIPFMSTAHGFYKPRLGRRLFPCWGERVIAISSLVADELHKKHGVPKKNIRVVHNAIDMETFQAKLKEKEASVIREGLGIPEGAYVVGSISRLVRDKGHDYLLEAVQKVKKNEPRAFLLIVGDGRERSRLEKRVEELGLTGSVRMIPGVGQTPAILPAIDLFVHPATYREGFGLSIAEAMAANKPVLTTDIPAINSLFHDGLDSCIVKPKSSDALAAAIQKFMTDAAYAQKIAEGGYQLASILCKPERMANETEAVYRELVAV